MLRTMKIRRPKAMKRKRQSPPRSKLRVFPQHSRKVNLNSSRKRKRMLSMTGIKLMSKRLFPRLHPSKLRVPLQPARRFTMRNRSMMT